MLSDSLHLLIIGDSITLGATEVRGDEIVSRVRLTYIDLLCEKIPGLRVTANADMHRTTTDVLTILQDVLAQVNPDVVLVMAGGNDADLNWRRFVVTDGRAACNAVPVARYAQNLRQIVATSLARGITPVLTDMPSQSIAQRGQYISGLCGKDVTAMLERCGGQVESDRRLGEYREAAAQVAAEMRTDFAPYGPALARHRLLDVLGVDGVHPNELAHRVIAEALAPTVASLVRRKHHARPNRGSPDVLAGVRASAMSVRVLDGPQDRF